jgi:hypothetical protein
MAEYIPRVGDTYLCTTKRYIIDRILTIVCVTDKKVYWDLEHRTSSNRVHYDSEPVTYYDAIDRQYFNKFANNAGLVKGAKVEPSWEV